MSTSGCPSSYLYGELLKQFCVDAIDPDVVQFKIAHNLIESTLVLSNFGSYVLPLVRCKSVACLSVEYKTENDFEPIKIM